MDLHAWITQQVDHVEAAARARLVGRPVNLAASGCGDVITGTITEVGDASDGLRFTVARYGVEPVDPRPAPVDLVSAALRRCEADRRILARHAPQPDGTGFPDGQQCRTCSQDGGDGYQYLVPYPCPTITDLAHAHGHTAERETTPPITTSDVPEALRGPRWKP